MKISFILTALGAAFAVALPQVARGEVAQEASTITRSNKTLTGPSSDSAPHRYPTFWKTPVRAFAQTSASAVTRGTTLLHSYHDGKATDKPAKPTTLVTRTVVARENLDPDRVLKELAPEGTQPCTPPHLADVVAWPPVCPSGPGRSSVNYDSSTTSVSTSTPAPTTTTTSTTTTSTTTTSTTTVSTSKTTPSSTPVHTHTVQTWVTTVIFYPTPKTEVTRTAPVLSTIVTPTPKTEVTGTTEPAGSQ